MTVKLDREDLLHRLEAVEPGLSPRDIIEQWVPIRAFKGYEVSNFGAVKSIERTCSHWTGQRKVSEKMLKLRKLTPEKANSYLRVGLRRNGKQRMRFVHRLVWKSFVGPIPKGLEPNHKNGIKFDNRLSNLELLTHQQNIDHAVETGLYSPAVGEDSGPAVLTEELVLWIRKKYEDLKDKNGRWPYGMVKTLSSFLEIHPTLIHAIIKRKIWRHI